MRKFRLTMLGLLCAGLLLGGVGAGVAFAEFSSFTYAGEQLFAGAQPRTQTLTVELENASGPVYLNDNLSSAGVRLRDVTRLETRDDVVPGTVCLEVTYESAGPEVSVWTNSDSSEQTEWLYLSWSYRSDLALVLACKDQVLADIRDHRLGDYIPARLTAVVISVNPADADRVNSF